MSKSKWVISSVLVVALVAATGLGAAGCAKNSNVGQNGSAPSVTTENAQSSSSDQQQAQANGQSAGNFNPQQMQANIKSALSGLVSKGTITQAQADKVVQLFANNKPGQGQDQFAQLVANGTLTQDQANAVKQALPGPQDRTGSPGTGQTSNQ